MAQDISFDPQKYASELYDKAKKIMPTGKTLETFQHDLDVVMRPGVNVSYETELHMLKKVLNVLETVTQKGIEWSGIKDAFTQQGFAPEDQARAAKFIEDYTAPGVVSYLTQDGQQPTTQPQIVAELVRTAPDSPTQSPAELSPMETLNKIMDAVSQDFVGAFTQNERDHQDLTNSQRKKAMDPIIEDMSKQLGISQDNLRMVASYLRMDPTRDDAEYQKAAEKKLNGILDVMKSHLPEGAVDQATLDAWKQKVEVASQTLKDLQNQWNELAATKGFCEQQQQQCEQAVLAQKKELAACDKAIADLEGTIAKKMAEFKEQFPNIDVTTLTDPEAPASKAWTELTNLGKQLADHKADHDLAKATLDGLESDLKKARTDLAQTEAELKQKTFDVRAAMMVHALQGKMKDAIEHMPLLEARTQEAQDLVTDVQDLKRDYEDLAQQYKGVRIELGEKLQNSPSLLLQDIGDALIAWKIKDIQRDNEWDTNLKMAKMDLSTRFDKFKLEFGGIFNHSSNAYIDFHTKRAMKELNKINKIDAQIAKHQKRAEQQAMRQIRREMGGRRMTKAEIEQSPEYQARVKELADKRTANLRTKRETHIANYQEKAQKVKDAAQRRNAVFQKHQTQRQELYKRIDTMRSFGDIGERAKFSFSQDLKSILPQNAQVQTIFDKSKQFAQEQQEQSHDGGRER